MAGFHRRSACRHSRSLFRFSRNFDCPDAHPLQGQDLNRSVNEAALAGDRIPRTSNVRLSSAGIYHARWRSRVRRASASLRTKRPCPMCRAVFKKLGSPPLTPATRRHRVLIEGKTAVSCTVGLGRTCLISYKPSIFLSEFGFREVLVYHEHALERQYLF